MNDSHTAAGSAQTVMDRVRSTASAQISNQKDRATDGLGSLAHAVRQTAQPLRDSQQNALAEYADKAADQIERLSSQLRERDVSELMEDAQRFARRQPAVFIGTAFAVGVFAARFLKSKGDRQNRGWQDDRAAGPERPFRAPASHVGGLADDRTGYAGGAV
jgi:hypothetical protein